MMSRGEAFRYLEYNYHIDEMSHVEFEEAMRILIDKPHKPWCRTRMRSIMPNYGADCTCGEGLDTTEQAC